MVRSRKRQTGAKTFAGHDRDASTVPYGRRNLWLGDVSKVPAETRGRSPRTSRAKDAGTRDEN